MLFYYVKHGAYIIKVVTILRRTERAMFRATCGVKLLDRNRKKHQRIDDNASLTASTEMAAKAIALCWVGHIWCYMNGIVVNMFSGASNLVLRKARFHRKILKIVNQTKEKEAPDSSFALIRALQCCISFFSRESNSSIPDVDGFQ